MLWTFGVVDEHCLYFTDAWQSTKPNNKSTLQSRDCFPGRVLPCVERLLPAIPTNRLGHRAATHRSFLSTNHRVISVNQLAS